MANEYFVNSVDLSSVADAIREKGETTEQLVFPSGFVTAIQDIKGGGNLNFEVVGNPKPSNPKENTIWIDTSTEITGWSFNSRIPSVPSPGMVWIETTLNGTELNALTEDEINLKISASRQYDGSGNWLSKEIQIYQGGAWITPLGNVLYNAGNTYDAITGGWTMGYPMTEYQNGGSGSFQSDYITITNASSSAYGIYTEKSIDLTNYKSLHVKSSGGNQRISVASYFPRSFASVSVTRSTSAGDDVILDISSLSGFYEIAINAEQTTATKIYRIWLS